MLSLSLCLISLSILLGRRVYSPLGFSCPYSCQVGGVGSFSTSTSGFLERGENGTKVAHGVEVFCEVLADSSWYHL